MIYKTYLIENKYYLIIVNQGLAFDFLPNSHTFFLLNKENFDKINSSNEQDNSEIFGELGFYLDKDKNKIDTYRGNLEKIDNHIVGISQISLSPKNKNVYNIRQIVIKKGLYIGKLFYNIIFNYIESLDPQNLLTSDRDSVSPLAKERWEKFFKDNQNYEKMEIDNYNNPNFPRTPQKIDDEYGVYKKPDTSAIAKNNKFLNYLYKIINPKITFNEIQLTNDQNNIIEKIITNNFIIKKIIKKLYKTHGN